jgi:hypothetical protein
MDLAQNVRAILAASLLALAIVGWLISSGRHRVPAHATRALVLMLVWSVIAIANANHPAHYGHDTADIGGFFVNTAGCGLVLAGIVAASIADSWRGATATVLLLLTGWSAMPPVFLWLAGVRADSDAASGLLQFGMTGAVVLLEVGGYALAMAIKALRGST